MVIALFVFTILNYYTFAFDLPVWFNVVSYIAQLGCIMTAQAIWEKWKAEAETLRGELKRRKKKQ